MLILPERGPPVADPHLGKRRENICSIHYKAYVLYYGFILFIKKLIYLERECVVQIGAWTLYICPVINIGDIFRCHGYMPPYIKKGGVYENSLRLLACSFLHRSLQDIYEFREMFNSYYLYHYSTHMSCNQPLKLSCTLHYII